MFLEQGSPTSGSQTSTSCHISDSIRLEIKITINIMGLNHPQTISPPSQSMEKLSSTKPVPDVKKVGDHCFKGSNSILKLQRITQIGICNI